MITSFMLICAKDNSLEESLKTIEGVKEVYSLYGMFDIIIKIEAETMNDVTNVVFQIRKMHDVQKTITLFTS